MSKIKIAVIGVLTTALVVSGAAGGILYYRNSRQDTVPVVSVDSIATDYYTDEMMPGRQHCYQCNSEHQCR